jgi:hypothetical protein
VTGQPIPDWQAIAHQCALFADAWSFRDTSATVLAHRLAELRAVIPAVRVDREEP